jgi:hypothetical protein
MRLVTYLTMCLMPTLRGGLLSNDGEKHHDLCRWICCGRSYYQS